MWGRNIHNMKWQDSANTAARWHGWTGREVFTPGTSRGGEEVLFEHLIWRIVFSGGSQHLHRIFHPVMAHPGAVAFTYVCTRSIWQLIQIQIFYKLSIVEDFFKKFFFSVYKVFLIFVLDLSQYHKQYDIIYLHVISCLLLVNSLAS